MDGARPTHGASAPSRPRRGAPGFHTRRPGRSGFSAPSRRGTEERGSRRCAGTRPSRCRLSRPAGGQLAGAPDAPTRVVRENRGDIHLTNAARQEITERVGKIPNISRGQGHLHREAGPEVLRIVPAQPDEEPSRSSSSRAPVVLCRERRRRGEIVMKTSRLTRRRAISSSSRVPLVTMRTSGFICRGAHFRTRSERRPDERRCQQGLAAVEREPRAGPAGKRRAGG